MDDDSCPICGNPDDLREQIGCAFINPKRAGCPYFDQDNKPKSPEAILQDGGRFDPNAPGAVTSTELAGLIVRRPMPGDGGKSRVTLDMRNARVIPVPHRIEDPEDVIAQAGAGSRYLFDGHDSLHDMISTHIEAWRDAIKMARNGTDSAYWDHELRALEKIEKACERLKGL